MNHHQLVSAISTATGVKKTDTDKVLKQLGDNIAAELVSQGSINLQGIGTISVADTPARPGRNPQTGEAITIAAGKRIKLKAAKALKEAVA